jgi:hypothetical protein
MAARVTNDSAHSNAARERTVPWAGNGRFVARWRDEVKNVTKSSTDQNWCKFLVRRSEQCAILLDQVLGCGPPEGAADGEGKSEVAAALQKSERGRHCREGQEGWELGSSSDDACDAQNVFVSRFASEKRSRWPGTVTPRKLGRCPRGTFSSPVCFHAHEHLCHA